MPDRHRPHRIVQPGEHDPEAVVIVSSPGLALPIAEFADLRADVRAQAAAACARSEELQQWTRHVLAEAQAVMRASVEARRRRWSSPAGRELMQRSAYARLLARLETMPVIEQAKGIIMAQSQCGDAEAFGVLRRASQRSNVPVRELAAQIVAKTAQVPPERVRQISRGGEGVAAQ